MKEKFSKIMNSGGYAVIIAIVSMALYLGVLSGAQKCSSDSLEPVEIRLTDEGQLFLNYVYDDKDELMILWETDGGHIANASSADTIEGMGYYLYGNVGDKIIWNKSDNDGNEYSTATVRAVLYEKTQGKHEYFIGEAAAEVQITLSYKEGKLVKVEDRMFSNPIRENSDGNWSQIYVINEGENGINSYRYRTGCNIPEEEYLYLRWEADDEILCETDIRNGMLPSCGVLNSNKNKSKIVQVNTVSIFEEKEKGTISAFIVSDKYFEQPEVEEKNKINIAELELD